MDDYQRQHLSEITRRFPTGCLVRRKSGVRIGECTSVAQARVEKVVMTGIHRDTFLKTDEFLAKYLDPDAYEVVTEHGA